MGIKLLWTGVTLFVIAIALTTIVAPVVVPLEIASAIILVIGTFAIWQNQ